jgi:hypothetical protein
LAETADVSAAVVVIAAMATPALFIVGTASLASSAIVRMGRIVDRARVLMTAANEGTWEKLGATPEMLDDWIALHARRAGYTELSVAALYGAVAFFVASALAIVVDRFLGGVLSWMGVVLAMIGALLVLVGGGYMVAESRLAHRQIQQEIRRAAERLRETRR